MKFRYTFEKNWKKMPIEISLITMSVYEKKYVDSGHKVVKREVFDEEEGVWTEII